MNMQLNNMLADILKAEGGYVNHPADKGGETNFGITVATARANGFKGDMKDMTRDEALSIYQRKYFFAPGYDKVSRVSAEIAYELFDTGVNMGPQVSSTFLQRCLNALNGSASLYDDLVVDGMVGTKTVAALEAFIKARGDEGSTRLLKALNCLQGAAYIGMAERRPENEAFLFGWLNRVSI